MPILLIFQCFILILCSWGYENDNISNEGVKELINGIQKLQNVRLLELDLKM